MQLFFKLLKRIAFFLILTTLTQIGGLIYLISSILSQKLKFKIGKRIGLFLIIYLIFTLLIIPPIAKQFGRVQLPFFASNEIPLKPANKLYFFLNRNYVRPKLKTLIETTAKEMSKQFPETQILYLDANFPFFNGFPLLPHLSHNDGRKLDINFLYKNKKTDIFYNKSPNFVGYGFCEIPRKGEKNYPEICKKKGYWQYNLLSIIGGNTKDSPLIFDKKRNIALLKFLAKNKMTRRIFIEPHLKTRLGLRGFEKIRFHGCQAVRHDDHIHLEVY